MPHKKMIVNLDTTTVALDIGLTTKSLFVLSVNSLPKTQEAMKKLIIIPMFAAKLRKLSKNTDQFLSWIPNESITNEIENKTNDNQNTLGRKTLSASQYIIDKIFIL